MTIYTNQLGMDIRFWYFLSPSIEPKEHTSTLDVSSNMVSKNLFIIHK